MIAYLDTSAFVPLLFAEKGSESSRSLWSNASTVVSTRLLYVEAAAAVARSSREQGLAPDEVNRAVASLAQRWKAVVPIEVGTGLAEAAAEAALRFGLRGYDAVHCAAAALIRGDEVVAASSDRQLLAAWRDLGLATFDPAG
ncbi:MAG: type II toxin-antitoxin system VapC family toxin [Solirubrobacterales bacterium]|nr:type II toxin-antitoxin system VapC family toxin [Solirubrobacterales bacterium]MCB0860603.1 type II toxin-antitoxin system VapC family toxin [Solirubrobacterales bacterium]